MNNMFLLLVVLNSVLLVCCLKDVTLVRDVRNNRESSEDDIKVNKIMKELQDTCIQGDDNHKTVKGIEENTQTILDKIEEYKKAVKLNTQLRKKIKWIIKESKGERENGRIFELLKQNIKGICLPPKDCTDLKRKTKKKLSDGVYKINPGGDNPVQAYCDMTTDGGGWTAVIAFDGETFIGNNYTHILTSSGNYELRVDLVDSSGNRKYALYKTFSIGDAGSKYKLIVDNFSGTAVDSMRHHNGMKFTTIDQDNDNVSFNCAVVRGGSWWYYGCTVCDLTSSGKFTPFWLGIKPVAKSVMMIRKT